MCLIYTADIEEFLYALVRSLHCLCVIVIIGAFVLIYQNAVFGKGIIAVAVKFAGEKTFSRAKGVGAVNDYKVVAVFLCAHVSQAVLKVEMHPWVIKLAGSLRNILAANIHHFLIYLHHVDVFDSVIACKLTDSSAVTCAYNEHLFISGLEAIATWVIIS